MASIRTTNFDFKEENFSIDSNGNLNILYSRNVEVLGLGANQYTTNVDPSEALSFGQLKDGYLEEELKFKVQLGASENTISEFTEKFYYKIDTMTSAYNYYSVNVTLWQDEEPCSNPNLGRKTTLFYLMGSNSSPVGQVLYNSANPFVADYFDGEGFTYIEFENTEGLFKVLKQNENQWWTQPEEKIICNDTTNTGGGGNGGQTESPDIRFTVNFNPPIYSSTEDKNTTILVVPKITSMGSSYVIKSDEIKITVYNVSNVRTEAFRSNIQNLRSGQFLFTIPKLPLIDTTLDGVVSYKIEDTVKNKNVSFTQVISATETQDNGGNTGGGTGGGRTGGPTITPDDCTVLADGLSPDSINGRETITCDGENYVWNTQTQTWDLSGNQDRER